MNPLVTDVDLTPLPRFGSFDLEQLWEDLPLVPIPLAHPLLDLYMLRHEAWTEKMRVIGLDAGLTADRRLLPGLADLVEHLVARPGWVRPDVFVVSDIGRKGVDGWSAIAVVSGLHPMILLGVHLVEALAPTELAFVLGHEMGHLLGYDDSLRREMSMSFLIRECVESNNTDMLGEFGAAVDWEGVYRTIMHNQRTLEVRCDRLGLLLCGNVRHASTALLTSVLKSPGLAREVHLGQYLGVQLPMLSSAPAAGPFSVNAGHPFVPFRLQHLTEFFASGGMDCFAQAFGRADGAPGTGVVE